MIIYFQVHKKLNFIIRLKLIFMKTLLTKDSK